MSPFMTAPLRPASGHEDQGRLEPEAQILVQPDAQVGLALPVVEVPEDAHLGPVLRTFADLGRRAPAEPAVARVAETQRGEDGLHRPGALARAGLAAVGARH